MRRYEVVPALLALVDELNGSPLADPDPLLPPPGYSLSISTPRNPFDSACSLDGVHVELVIAYESGGSEESSYALNDRVLLTLEEKRISGIRFEREAELREHTDVELREDSVRALLHEIREFCRSPGGRESGRPPPV